MVRIWAQRDQGNLLKSKLKFFMPKSKGAKNELKTPEQAIKSKILHVVRIRAQTDQRNPLKSNLKNLMPKPKGAQNELKMPELAIKCKNLHLVQIWAQTDQRNPWNQSWKIWCPNLMVLKMSWKHQNWLWNKKSCMWIWAKTDQPNPLNKPCKYLNAQIISNILQFYCHHSLTTIFSARWLEKLSKTSSFLTLLLSLILNH